MSVESTDIAPVGLCSPRRVSPWL